MINMMKKYNTNDLFNKEGFVKALTSMGITCEAVADGVLINIDEYKANYNPATAPHIVFMNHRWVKAL